jgi:molybdate transport system substrate-binding protein
MTTTLKLMSGGAAQGLIEELRDDFERVHDCRIQGSFGAIGGMKDRLLAGEACDLFIVSDAMVRDMASQGHIDAGSITPLGNVHTGLATLEGAQFAPVTDEASLRTFLAGASAIHFPDPAKATAGIHFMKVLKALGLDTAGTLRTHPNGNTAMKALAQAADPRAVGCTQVTEILFTPGVRLHGLLPAPHGLATVYTAGVCTNAAEPALARALAAALAAPDAAAARRACGFEPV